MGSWIRTKADERNPRAAHVSGGILVVGAHPDDEILGAGATLARHVDAGREVHAVICSEGASSRYADGMKRELTDASNRSAEVIGFVSMEHLGMPDQRLDTMPLIDVTQQLEQILRNLKPAVVYTHAAVDVNADHGVVARALWTACRPFAAPFVKRFLAFETPSSTEWAWPTMEAVFHPQVFSDVEATLERKVAAMDCYESELRGYPHPRSARALRERAAYWGSVGGVRAAEAFVLLRSLE